MVAHFSIPNICLQPPATAFCLAKAILPVQRQELALHALAGTATISQLAAQNQVSRKFIYQQVHTAEGALQEAFVPEQDDATKVLLGLIPSRDSDFGLS